MTDEKKRWDDLRNRVIGLGEQSSRKSYYPELQKKLEELKASENDLMTLFDSTYDSIFIHDTEGNVLDVNKSMIHMYGLHSKEEALAYKISDYTDVATPKERFNLIWEMLKENPDNVVFEWKARRPLTDKVFDVEVALRPIKWKKKDAVVAVVRDISMRKIVEKEKVDLLESLLNAKSEADRANAAKSDFLINMSHEIRTPMNTILGLVDVLSEMPLQKEQHDLIDTIKKSGKLLVEIVNNVLDLSKIEAGLLEIGYETFELRSQIEAIVNIFQRRAEEKGLYFNTQILSDVPNYFKGDIVHLKQVLLNLFSNAIKFTSKGGISFTVSLCPEQKFQDKIQLCFEIQDSGIGIPSDKLMQITQQFNLKDQQSAKHLTGTGLGLMISAKMISLMGGEIKVESHFGQGAIFRCLVPLELNLKIAQQNQQYSNTSHSPYESLKGKKVLLVDDADENRQLLHLYMRKCDLIIDEAINGEEACAKFVQGDYDVILMDISMPVMDGYSAVKLIRQYELELNRKPIPIIACTAFALKEEKEKCFAVGCSAHLAKPISKATLLQTLVKYL